MVKNICLMQELPLIFTSILMLSIICFCWICSTIFEKGKIDDEEIKDYYWNIRLKEYKKK